MIELAVERVPPIHRKNVKEEDRVDFGASECRDECRGYRTIPNGVVLLPMTAGGVVIAYNLPDLEGTLKLHARPIPAYF